MDYYRLAPRFRHGSSFFALLMAGCLPACACSSVACVCGPGPGLGWVPACVGLRGGGLCVGLRGGGRLVCLLAAWGGVDTGRRSHTVLCVGLRLCVSYLDATAVARV